MSGYYNRNNRGITKKLGPVTAYADAVLAGYKGTREQWAQDMANLGQNVTQVAQNTELTTELAEQTRENTEQVAKDTADVRRLADETGDNATQVASNTAESNRLAKETKQAAAQAKADAEYAGAAADNFRVDTTLSEEGKAAEAKTTGEKFAQLSEEISDIADAVMPKTFLTLEFDSVEEGKAYSTQVPAGETISGYNTYNKTVSAGETIYINTTVVPAAGYSVCVFYNKGAYVNVKGQYPTYSGEVLRHEVVIPDGVDTLKITAATSAAVSIEKKERVRSFMTWEDGQELFDAVNKFSAKMYVSLSDDILNVVTKYTKTHDMRVRFGKRGVNRLPDFVSLGLIANTSAVPSENVDNVEIFLNSGSDWFAPYVLQAKDNADGDLPEGYVAHFTGGNHEYTNTGTGGTATARCAVLRYFIDGRECEVYKGYASKVEIRWTNYVQGNNTKKVDGTGREILQENHTMVFDGTVWKVDVDLIPLEDILVKTWYGFQICGVNSTVYSNVRYIGAKNRGLYTYVTSSTSGNAKATGIMAYGSVHKILCEIDPVYDLGNREYYTETQGAFTMGYGKSYFYVVKNGEFASGDMYALRGRYKFMPA